MKLFISSAVISVFTAFCLTISSQTRAQDYSISVNQLENIQVTISRAD
jgi:hypothetical protein